MCKRYVIILQWRFDSYHLVGYQIFVFLLPSDTTPQFLGKTKVSFVYMVPVLPICGPFLVNSRNLFGPEEPFVKLRPAYSVKLDFSYVVKGIKLKTAAKFHASRRLRCAHTKRIISPDMSPKSFGTFEKQTPCPSC